MKRVGVLFVLCVALSTNLFATPAGRDSGTVAPIERLGRIPAKVVLILKRLILQPLDFGLLPPHP